MALEGRVESINRFIPGHKEEKQKENNMKSSEFYLVFIVLDHRKLLIYIVYVFIFKVSTTCFNQKIDDRDV